MGIPSTFSKLVLVYIVLQVIIFKDTQSESSINCSYGCKDLHKRLVLQQHCSNQVLAKSLRYRAFQSRSKLECVAECSRDQNCKSIVFDPKVRLCQLGDAKAADNCSNMEPPASATVAFYQEPPQCGNGEEMGPMGYCVCARGFTGVPCQRYFNDCRDAMRHQNVDSPDVVNYFVSPLNVSAPFEVRCRKLYYYRTYIMDRRNGEVSFHRNWTEYRDGFGNIKEGDFWLGLEKIYALTSGRDQELNINFKVKNDTNYVLNYSNFRISDKAMGYRLFFNNSVLKRPNDCLQPLLGAKFSTYDNDGDGDKTVDCAEKRQGGFWFKGSANCSACNPTGMIYKPLDGLRLGYDNETFWTSLLGDRAVFKVSMYLIPMP